jgi:tRNA dimethylallyltransferase
MNNTLIVLLGPTGVGKTDLSIELAGYFGTEIISCDSRQFYREMQIGTAVPSDKQLKEIRHHFIRFISVKDYYSASLFERDVLNLIPTLFQKNNSVIMTGGSGLYIEAVCIGIDSIPDVDPSIREKYMKKYREEGIESLRVDLKLLDPEHYSKVDLRNYKRILRALEICETTGYPYSSFLNREKRERNFNIIKIGLNIERKDLYERINKRVDKMIESGLEAEVRSLIDRKDYNALNTVGYKEFFDFFEKKTSFEETVRLIKRNTRRYAKRQLTWWMRDKDIMWFSPDKKEDIITYISANRLK